MRSQISAIIFIFIMASYSQALEGIPDDVKATAENWLYESQNILNEKNYKSLGFERPDELQRAELGVPIQEFMVRQDDLAKYTREQTPTQLLKGRREYTYPVLVTNKLRSSITVAWVGKRWSVVSLGRPNRIKIVETARDELSVALKMPKASFFLVKVPSIYYVFLGFYQNKALILNTLLEDPRLLKLKPGTPMAAEQVFELLAPLVKSHTLK